MRVPNYKCVICGKDIYVRPYRLENDKHGFTCSKECGRKNRSLWFRGENNHQYGLKEDLNKSFKSWKKKSNYGYILVHCKNHPFCDSGGMVREHRLVVEENYTRFDRKFFIKINGKYYLRPEFQVHHINENKIDNRIENLMIVTKAEHRGLHNLNQEILRNKKGQIIAIRQKGGNNERKNQRIKA